ncbi:hypothetical protein RRG08_032555 [Elysia crispata]|uniref:Uncharacterized protein n=1 Tax=Elysia crispata TaxID=231223 RepID=A0AAE1DP24_9GAST|nr:hypothetical protein RRG08_032555 [Elysia crispata]
MIIERSRERKQNRVVGTEKISREEKKENEIGTQSGLGRVKISREEKKENEIGTQSGLGRVKISREIENETANLNVELELNLGFWLCRAFMPLSP